MQILTNPAGSVMQAVPDSILVAQDGTGTTVHGQPATFYPAAVTTITVTTITDVAVPRDIETVHYTLADGAFTRQDPPAPTVGLDPTTQFNARLLNQRAILETSDDPMDQIAAIKIRLDQGGIE